MSNKKTRITIDLEQEEYKQLVRLKQNLDRSLSWLGRQAICDLLEKHNAICDLLRKQNALSEGELPPYLAEVHPEKGRAE